MTEPPPDSAVLQETNDRWLDRLFRTEAPRLARFIRRAVRNQDEVHDLVQETFVKLVASPPPASSEEHTSELQSLMRISYAVFCLKQKKTKQNRHRISTSKTTTHRK